MQNYNILKVAGLTNYIKLMTHLETPSDIKAFSNG